MKLEVLKTAQEVAKRAAELVSCQIRQKPDTVLGLPTGSTPLGLYKALSNDRTLDFSGITTFNLDEYFPISPEDPQSYRYFMNENLFRRINIPLEQTHVPDGSACDPAAVCVEYEAAIEAAGGIDLQVLGVGRNGHIGFNEPGCAIDGSTHMVKLTESTINANARFFARPSDVPTKALTMGIGTILKARKILILITGTDKHEALKALLSGVQSEDWPVTALQTHDDVTILCDRAAYDRFYLGVDLGGTMLKVGVVSDAGEIVESVRIPTEKSSKEALLDQIADACRSFLQKYPITAAGIGLPGIVDPGTGKVGACGNLPLTDTDIRKELEGRLGLPFAVENDANCAALAEHRIGAGKGSRDLILVTIGTGIGGGILLDGKLYHGKNGGSELGHLITHAGGKPCPCGQKGCLEQYASASALQKAVSEAAASQPDSILARTMKEEEPCKAVFTAKAAGCPLADAVLEEYFSELTCGLKSICQIFGPDALLLAGGITEQGDALLKPLQTMLPGQIPLRLASLGSRAGLIGAALLPEWRDHGHAFS